MTPVSDAKPANHAAIKTIFVECTHTYHSDMNTGIQRVVRNVIRNGPSGSLDQNIRIVPVIFDRGELLVVPSEKLLRDNKIPKQRSWRKVNAKRDKVSRAPHSAALKAYMRSLHAAALAPVPRELYRYGRTVIAALFPFRSVSKFVWAPRSEPGLTRALMLPLVALRGLVSMLTRGVDKAAATGQPVGGAGDVLLLLDASWSISIWSAVRAFKARGGVVIGVIYDLIPISHPHACVPVHTAAFSEWLRQYCALCDGTIAISRTVMQQFEMYVALCGHKRWMGADAPIRYFHLGSDLDLSSNRAGLPLQSPRARGNETPTFLMVGSIEPRKNHALVLAAFDQLWAQNKRVRLVLIGRQAWRTEDFLTRVSAHPQLGVNLFLHRDAPDAELEEYYQSSSALIIASEIEGFGLPIIEAYQRGLPVICSDIPVFREIAADSATYFDLDNPHSLPRVIMGFLEASGATQEPLPRPLTWRESTDQLLSAIADLAGGIAKAETASIRNQGR